MQFRRTPLRAVVGALLATAVGCNPCGSGMVTHDHVDAITCGGTLMAPTALGLPATVPLTCSAGAACIPQPTCLMNPTMCTSTCIELNVLGQTDHSQGLQITWRLSDPQHSQSLVLPSTKVAVNARYFDQTTGLTGTPLTVVSGMLSSTLSQGKLDTTFQISLATPAGDQIEITNGVYNVADQVTTSCLAN